MRLWHLLPINKIDSDPTWHENRKENPWAPWFDKAFGFVVRADTEQSARLMAASQCGDEGGTAWTSAEYSTCILLDLDGEPGVIERNFASA